ncbi:MAG: FAD-dependent oxidoreductase [Cyanobacteriota bacterium]|nr:FAD-dependent oxidoreductase [Cyanobacteriota bacterium]
MNPLAGKHISYWIDSTAKDLFVSAIDDVSVDVAIVGAGIPGITAATLLKQAGKTVALIDADGVGMGASGHTTAKITALHQIIYFALVDEIGEEKARLYGESNLAAIEQIAKLVEQEQLDCDFERRSAYTFAESEENLEPIEKEVEACNKLGLPATFVRETSLPFQVAGAIRFDDQAQFHPRKYILQLAKNLPGNGSHVFENTRVLDVESGSPCQVRTERGTIRATDVILASNIPMLDRGLFFAKSYPKRSYLVAGKIDPEKAPDGMFIGTGDSYRSIRTTPSADGMLLLVGGEGHKTGSVDDTEERYAKLEQYLRDRFEVEPEYRWSSQDMMSMDKRPYIGKLTPLDERIYVATGFSLWGMTNGTLAAMILRDLITGVENPWADLYEATRATPFLTEDSIQENMDVTKHWIGDRFKGADEEALMKLAPGEGQLVNVDGEKLAAYRDETGVVRTVSAVCSHLGCIVNWNPAEKSWDCPCHGARFNCDGKVLRGPAVTPLEAKNAASDD